MRRARLATGVAVLAGLTWGSSARAGDVPAGGLHIEVVQGLFRDVPAGMVKVLGGPLRELINRRAGLTGDFSMAPDALTLADRMKDNKCQLGVFHGFEFAWAQARNPDLIPLVVTVYPSGNPQACVVVGKESTATKLSDLPDGSIAVPKGTKGHCFAFLSHQGAAAKEAGKDKPRVSPEEALDAVVSGTNPAAVVDVGALQGYEKLCPAAFKRLRVLCQSEPFPQNVIAYNKGALTPEAAEQLRQVLVGAHLTPGGKPLMMLWSIKRFGDVPADYQDQLAKSAKAYPAPATAESGGTSTAGARVGGGGR